MKTSTTLVGSATNSSKYHSTTLKKSQYKY
jgi:hypothetical protein